MFRGLTQKSLYSPSQSPLNQGPSSHGPSSHGPSSYGSVASTLPSSQAATGGSNSQLASPAKTKYTCEQCQKSFVSKLGYQTHMNRHKGIYKFTCSTCNKGFDCTKNYKEHLTSHTGLLYFSCNNCGQSFKYNHQLQTHKTSCVANTGTPT